MRVALTGNVQPWRTRSMALYRQRLCDAFGPMGDVEMQAVDFRWDMAEKSRMHTGLPGKLLYQASRWIGYPFDLRMQLARLQPDLLHVTDQSYGELCASWRGAVVATVHDLIPVHMRAGRLGDGPGARISGPAWALFQRALRGLRMADHIICISQHTANDLLTEIPDLQGRITVVHHGIEESFAPRSAAEHRESTSHFVVLHVGNNWAYKNVDGVVRIVSGLGKVARGHGCTVSLLRVGDPLRASQLAELHKAGIAVEQRQARSAADLVRAYQDADLFVFPSLYEGFGWPPLEAMACGVPCVVSACGSLAEIAGPGAALVLQEPEQATADELAAIWQVLRDNAVREAAIQTGLDWVRRYSWQTCALQTAAVYRSVCA